MELNEIIRLIKTVKKYGSIKHYYSARSLRKEQKDKFENNGITVECRKRAKAWFEIDMVNA